MKLKCTILFILFGFPLIYPECFADSLSDKTIHIDKYKRIYLKGGASFFLRISNSSDDDATSIPLFNLDGKKESIRLLNQGAHLIGHQHKRNGRLNRKNNFKVILDKTPPLNSWIFTKSPKFRGAKGTFFGEPFKINLKARDTLSGVRSIHFKINDSEEQKFVKPIIVKDENYYELKFYSVDNVSNKSNYQKLAFKLDLTPPSSSYEIKGLKKEEILSKKASFSFEGKDMLSGLKNIVYIFQRKNGLFRKRGLFKGKDISLKKFPGGDYTLRFYSIDNVENREKEQKVEFHLDKNPPKYKASIIGDQFKVNGKIFVSGRSKVNIKSSDNKVDVKKVIWWFKKSKPKTFKEAFLLPPNRGAQEIFYNAVDSLGNWGKMKRLSVVLDLLPPVMEFKVIGRKISIFEKVFISPKSKIALKALDSGSGIKEIIYRADKGGIEGPQKGYKSPFSLKEEGTYNLNYFASDRVGNKMIEQKSTFVVDSSPPVINYHFSNTKIGEREIDGRMLPVLLPGSRVYLGSSDSLSGTKSIYYKIGGVAKRYKEPLQYWRLGKHELEIVCYDHVGNDSRMKISFIISKYK